jgi:DNA-directed RNA polymerase
MASVQQDLQNQDPEIRGFAEWWAGIGISRTLAKKPVMTYVYGATLKGTAEYIEDTLVDEGVQFPEGWQALKCCMYAARKLFQGIKGTVPAAANAMEWLRSIAQQRPYGQRMEWTTPTGFRVQHDYQDFTDIRIKLYSAGMTRVTVREFNEGTRALSMQNAIAPNFVHALDASHLVLTWKHMKAGSRSMIAIHDSFGTNACDVPEMHKDIRKAFVELYDNRNILGEFMWEVGAVGEPPMRGTFNVKSVLDSEFFFC